MDQTKKFREKEVQIRAAEFYQTTHKIGKSKTILVTFLSLFNNYPSQLIIIEKCYVKK
jgi:hypothetical protein